MTRFMSIDPGLQATGYAEFEDGVLVRVGLARSNPKDSLPDRVRAIAAIVLQNAPADRVCERMEVRGARNKGNPQALCDLCLLAGVLGTDWVLPREWKPNLQKEIHQPRILATLTAAEQALVAAVKPKFLAHNAVDAVGIGLARLGRLDKRGVRRPLKEK